MATGLPGISTGNSQGQEYRIQTPQRNSNQPLFSYPSRPSLSIQSQIRPPQNTGSSSGAGGLNLDDYAQFADAVYNQGLSRLEPQFQQQEDQVRQRLINQGLQPGTAAFESELNTFNRGRNDALNTLQNQATLTGLGAQEQAFSQGYRRDQLANAMQQALIGANATLGSARIGADSRNYATDIGRQNFIDQLGLSRDQFDEGRRQFDTTFGEGQRQFDAGFGLQSGQADFQNLTSLLGLYLQGNQINNQNLNNDYARSLQLLGLIPQAGFTPIDVTGAVGIANNANIAAQQAAAQRSSAGLGALGGIGSAGLALLCDASVKDIHGDVDCRTVLDGINGMPVVEWSYKGDDVVRIGPTAQAFADHIGGDGRTIDVASAIGSLFAAIKAISQRLDKLEDSNGSTLPDVRI